MLSTVFLRLNGLGGSVWGLRFRAPGFKGSWGFSLVWGLGFRDLRVHGLLVSVWFGAWGLGLWDLRVLG